MDKISELNIYKLRTVALRKRQNRLEGEIFQMNTKYHKLVDEIVKVYKEPLTPVFLYFHFFLKTGHIILILI